MSESSMLRAAEIRRVRRALSNAKSALNHLHNPEDLYISDHLALRIVERKLEKDIEIIVAMAMNFMINYFYTSTYTSRKYVVQLRDLKIGMRIELGHESKKRFAILATAFTTDQNYECDEHIQLK